MAKTKDPRLPNVGAVITRKYKGQDIEVTVADDGFVYDGTTWSSLSKLAAHICNQKAMNGFAFFKLGKKPRRKQEDNTNAVPTQPSEENDPEPAPVSEPEPVDEEKVVSDPVAKSLGDIIGGDSK